MQDYALARHTPGAVVRIGGVNRGGVKTRYLTFSGPRRAADVAVGIGGRVGGVKTRHLTYGRSATAADVAVEWRVRNPP